jgi:hypothetical protein
MFICHLSQRSLALLFKYGQVHFSPQEAAAYYANAACQVDDKELVTVEVIVYDAHVHD